MRFQGRLTSWDDAKGYGFITPNGGGPRVFVHRTDIDHGRRPRGNEFLTYERVVDDRQRHNARHVQYVLANRPRGLPAIGAMAAPLLALVFFSYLLSAGARGTLPWAVPAWYAVLSVITFLAYRHDKTAAKQRAWRTSENHLHLLALAGGWPGALIAQRWLRHKTRKQSFLALFFVTVTLNLGALSWFALSGQALLGRS